MRTLKFIVDKQIIKEDPKCDFNGLVPGTEGYVQASFSFSPEWDGCAKVASFLSTLGKEYPPQIITSAGNCMIPAEALKRRSFKIQVIGKDQNGARLKTNNIKVTQNGGKT